MADQYAKLNLRYLVAEKSGAILNVRFNRPEILNPLDLDTLEEMKRCLDVMDTDKDIEIFIIRGSGRAFSAGGDLKKHLGLHQDAERLHEINRCAHAVAEKIERTQRLVIAVVDGLCVAGGIELILFCDFVIASDEASFSDGHMNVGLLPGLGGTQMMPRRIGALRTKDLMLTARFIGGQEAARIGLVSASYPRAELEQRVSELTALLSSKSFAARAAIKYLVNSSMRSNLESGLQFESAYVEHFESTHPDAHEGLLAFSEKRKATFARPR